MSSLVACRATRPIRYVRSRCEVCRLECARGGEDESKMGRGLRGAASERGRWRELKGGSRGGRWVEGGRRWMDGRVGWAWRAVDEWKVDELRQLTLGVGAEQIVDLGRLQARWCAQQRHEA